MAAKSLAELKPGLRAGIVNGYVNGNEYPAAVRQLTQRAPRTALERKWKHPKPLS